MLNEDGEEFDNETLVLINEVMSESDLEKFFALKALKANPTILDNVYTFEKLCYVMNGEKPNVDFWDPPNSLQIAKTIKSLDLKEYNWNNELRYFIAHILYDEGWVTPPVELDFITSELNELQSDDFELNEDGRKLQELKHKAVKRYLEM